VREYTVLLIASLSNPCSDGWFYKGGLEQNGHRVVTFDPSGSGTPEKEVFTLADALTPDLILHTKDELPASTFQMLRKVARVIQWYPDPVIPAWLPEYVRAADIFFTMAEGLLDDFRELNPNAFWLSQAFAPTFFQTGEISEQERKRLSSEVVFVGNLGSKEQYLSRRDYLQAVIDRGFSLTWWGPRLPIKFSTLPLLLGRLGRAYGGYPVYGEEHAKIAQLAGVYLGFDAQPHVRKSMSERMYIAVGCGACYLCHHVEGIEEVLVPDREIVTFRTESEMIDKIDYYLTHEQERLAIAQAGRERVLREHTYDIRVKEMLSVIEGVD
jgi:spore maturation protein CgeB